NEWNLPQLIQMGEKQSFMHMDNAVISFEILWFEELARAAFLCSQSNTYNIATLGIKYLHENATLAVRKRIEGMQNPYKPGMEFLSPQHAPHLSNVFNATILDSVMVVVQHFQGTEYLFPTLGVANGFSMHEPFKNIEHGVGNILPVSEDGLPPDCMAIPLYSHADVYEGVAHHVASNSSDSDFSCSKFWFPFYTPDFDVQKCCARLMEEEKRLFKEYVKF
ncbi:hypothetical protein CROQUDRAFT_40963, partial [Cronartium quercuum f. sp. fusiforme G11]